MSNLFAAIVLSVVRLVPSAATNYVATIPVCTNLIKGIGMGPDADYTFPRAEDVEWLAEAATERRFGAGATSVWLPIYDWSWAIPREANVISTNVVLQMYQLSDTNTNHRTGVWLPSGNYGFVKPSFKPVETPFGGYAILCTNSDFNVNGYSVRSDIRAILGPDSSVFPTNELPPALDFRGPLKLSTITNAYALIDDGTKFSTVVYAREPYYYWSDRTHRTVTTNEYFRRDIDAELRFERTYYDIDDEHQGYSYLSGYTILSNRESSATYKTTGTSMDMYSSRTVSMETPASVRRISADSERGASVIVLNPFTRSDQYSYELPDSGSMFFVEKNDMIASGRVPGSETRLYNTNLAAKAWLVTCWTYTDSLTYDGAVPIYVRGQTVFTNVTVHATNAYFVTSFPIGDMKADGDFFVSSLHDSGEIAANAMWFAERTMHESMTDVGIDSPVSWTEEDYPSTIPDNITSISTGTMYNRRSKSIVQTWNNIILVITPEWRSRVLKD